jgi:hypothetical protein
MGALSGDWHAGTDCGFLFERLSGTMHSASAQVAQLDSMH